MTHARARSLNQGATRLVIVFSAIGSSYSLSRVCVYTRVCVYVGDDEKKNGVEIKSVFTRVYRMTA